MFFLLAFGQYQSQTAIEIYIHI